MNKVTRLFIVILIIACSGYLVYFGVVIFYSHSVDWDIDREYLYLFDEKVKKEINTDYSSSFVEENDVQSTFHYRDYIITTWEFKDLGNINFKDVFIKDNVELNNEKVRFFSGEIMDPESDIRAMVKFRFAFKNAITINVDNYSKVYATLNRKNCKGVYGQFNRFSLENDKNEHEIIIDYASGKTPTMLLAYKDPQNRFYIIIINAKHTITENDIKIMNLL